MGISNGDFAAILKELENDMSDILTNEVMRKAEKEFLSVAESNVYSAYSPKYYLDGSVFGRKRRYGNGGIYDITFIETTRTGKLSIEMEDIAPANTNNDRGMNAIEWVESGLNVPARQFYEPLQKKVDAMAENAMYLALKSRGW